MKSNRLIHALLCALCMGLTSLTPLFAQFPTVQADFEQRIQQWEDRDIFYRLMQTDSVLAADRFEQYTLYPSPSQHHPFMVKHGTNVKWEVYKGKLSHKYIIYKGEYNERRDDLFEKEEGDGESLQVADGEYHGMLSPLPYYGFWVGREGVTLRVKAGKIVTQTEWPPLKDGYFQRALSYLQRKKVFWHLKREELLAFAQTISSMLMSADLTHYFEQHPIEGGDSVGLYIRSLAKIEADGTIALSALHECNPQKVVMLERLQAWAKTLPPFAINGFYTHEGQYLPYRVMGFSYRQGEMTVHDNIELTQRFRKHFPFYQ